MTVVPASDALWTVPELGPSLGRLVDPSAASPGALRVPLDDIRLTLFSGVFDLAGKEIAAGMFTNDTLPEEKARELQAVEVTIAGDA